MRRIAAVVLGCLSMVACGSKPATTLVLDYEDFGPQVAAHELIGMAWWQWDPHGDPAPAQPNPIRVVVYRDVPLAEVQRSFPVVEATKQDFRYVSYEDATAYLDRTIRENVVPEVTERLEKTRAKIIKELEGGDGD